MQCLPAFAAEPPAMVITKPDFTRSERSDDISTIPREHWQGVLSAKIGSKMDRLIRTSEPRPVTAGPDSHEQYLEFCEVVRTCLRRSVDIIC